jgi:hypothetical protein
LAAPVAVMTVGIVMAAGCSSGGGLAVHPSGQATTSATPRPSSSTAAVPTGNQLGKVLAGARLPAGWKQAPGPDNLATSGSLNMAGDGPEPAEYTCKYLDSGLQAGYFISWYSSSSASIILVYPSSAARLPQVTLNIGGYAPGAAAKSMAKTAALMAHCRSFRDAGLDGDPTRTSVRTIPHLGNRNLFLTSTEHTKDGTLIGQMLLVQDGNFIVAVDTNTGLDGDVRPATVQGFGGWLVQLLANSKSLT